MNIATLYFTVWLTSDLRASSIDIFLYPERLAIPISADPTRMQLQLRGLRVYPVCSDTYVHYEWN
jgi:hypothetical protein